MGGKGVQQAGGLCMTVAVAVVAIFLGVPMATNRHWNTIAMKPEDYDWNDFNYTLKEIPMTTYDDEVPSWVDDFIVFRRSKKQTPEEMKALVAGLNSSVRAKRIDPTCELEASTVCQLHDCMTDLHNTDTAHVLAPNSGLYSSFSQITPDSIKAMFDATGIKIPGMEKSVVEHAFISNLGKSKLTAALHAAFMVSSSSVQLTGTKTWLFVLPKDFKGMHGFGALPAASTTITTKAPEGNMDFYVYNSEPGDVLFFPANTAHVVITHPGPNIMLNFRRLTWKSFAAQPFFFVHGMLNVLFFNKLGLGGGQFVNPEIEAKSINKKKAFVPEVPLTVNALKTVAENACPGGKPRAWDKHLVERFT